MKKAMFIALAAGLLCCAALAEGSPAPTAAIQLVTPTAAPQGASFSSEDLIVVLPYGMEILSEEALIGYEAAVQNDYPDAARTLLVAADASSGAFISFASAPIEAAALEAAKEAAEEILSDGSIVQEKQFGENHYAGFVCAIGEQQYRLYYLAGEGRMLIVGASGMEEAALEDMLAGIVF